MPLTRAPKADAATRVPLPLPPRRTVVIDAATGLFTRPWLTWLDLTWKRLGEAHAPSNAELDEAAQDQSEQIAQIEGDLGSTSGSLAALEAEVEALQTAYLGTVDALTALTTRVTTLEGQVLALQTTSTAQETRLAALEAWRVALVAALPAVVSVTPVPALGNDPATAILLENDLTANWRPPVNANDAALATSVNAVRAALAA